MERNPLMSFNDGLEITYSDLKHDKEEYIMLYFERPNDKEFDSAEFRYPGTKFVNVKGFKPMDLIEFTTHIKRLGPHALKFAKEDYRQQKREEGILAAIKEYESGNAAGPFASINELMADLKKL